jgi:hypothetical protein
MYLIKKIMDENHWKYKIIYIQRSLLYIENRTRIDKITYCKKKIHINPEENLFLYQYALSWPKIHVIYHANAGEPPGADSRVSSDLSTEG